MTEKEFAKAQRKLTDLLKEEWEKNHDRTYYAIYHNPQCHTDENGTEVYDTPIIRRFGTAEERKAALIGSYVYNDPFAGDEETRKKSHRVLKRKRYRLTRRAEKLEAMKDDDRAAEQARDIRAELAKEWTSWELKGWPVKREDAELLLKMGALADHFELEAAAAANPEIRKSEMYENWVNSGAIRDNFEAFGFLIKDNEQATA